MKHLQYVYETPETFGIYACNMHVNATYKSTFATSSETLATYI
jgi:hypothetical protein